MCVNLATKLLKKNEPLCGIQKFAKIQFNILINNSLIPSAKPF